VRVLIAHHENLRTTSSIGTRLTHKEDNDIVGK